MGHPQHSLHLLAQRCMRSKAQTLCSVEIRATMVASAPRQPRPLWPLNPKPTHRQMQCLVEAVGEGSTHHHQPSHLRRTRMPPPSSEMLQQVTRLPHRLALSQQVPSIAHRYVSTVASIWLTTDMCAATPGGIRHPSTFEYLHDLAQQRCGSVLLVRPA